MGKIDFIIIGNKNAITTKYVFPLLKDMVLKTGYTVPRYYIQPEWCETKSLNGLTRWFTTLPVTDKDPLSLTARYSPEKYPKYDNYDAIEVGSLKDIPFDYSGVMGVPITILDKNLNNIVVEGILYGEYTEIDGEYIKGHRPTLNGEQKYSRVLIKLKK